MAVDATLLAMVLGVLVALVVSPDRTRPAASVGRSAVLDAVFMLPLGVSAVTLGFGFLITLDRPPLDLRSSPAAGADRAGDGGAAAGGAHPRAGAPLRSTRGSARPPPSLGASPLRVLGTVDLPVVWRPLLAATGFAFAVSLGEFGATSFLARPGAAHLPVVIYELIGRPGADNYGMALAASVVLAAA